MVVQRFSLLTLILTTLLSVCRADIADKAWIFLYGGNSYGWSVQGSTSISNWGVAPGYLWAETSGVDPWVISPDNVYQQSNPSHYISIKMKMHLISSQTDRFGASDAQIYFSTTTSPVLDESKRVSFKVYGNGAWKVYNIRIGNHSLWNGMIKQIRIDPCSRAGARFEIEYIKIMRDTSPPVFTAENMWTYEDGEITNDSTPTIRLRNCYDLVSGIDRAEFYYRPGTSTSESAWVLAGLDADGSDGYQMTYPQLTDGTWDLGVKMFDKCGNVSYWTSGDDRWIDNLRIDQAYTTRIDVEADSVGDAIPKEIFGNNVTWNQWSSKYDANTKRLPDTLEARITEMGLPVLRYPGGCYSDTFYWKKSIGPVASRPIQYVNGCNQTLSNAGAAEFGLDEFLTWCEERGIQPMITCRFRWPGAPPAQSGEIILDGPDPYAEALQDAEDLVEYCNSPNDGSNVNGGTDWAAVRAANGHPEPYNVKLFEIGNEPWGPDPWGSPGNIGLDGPSEYSVAFLKYLERMKAVDPTIKVSATSHIQSQLDFDPVNPEWAWSVYEQTASYIDYAQIHPYLPYSGWQTDKIKLYDETMATPKALDDMLATQRTTIKMTAPEKAGIIKLRMTEWNINYNWWYDPSQGRINTYHTRTLKAAIALADAFRVFIENRDIVESGEWWHLYSGTWGCIGSDTAYTPYPAYHSFRIFNKHFGDRLVPSKVTGSPTFDYIQTPGGILRSQYDLAYLSAIASKSEDGKSLYLVVINKDRTTPHTSHVNIASFVPSPYSQVQAEIWELNGIDVDDYTNVTNVKITESTSTFDPGFSYTFPAHSVTSFKFNLAPVEAATVSRVKEFPDGTAIRLTGKTVTAVFSSNVFYIEDADRSSGIRVEAAGVSVNPGDTVVVSGTVLTNGSGERFIAADTVVSDN